MKFHGDKGKEDPSADSLDLFQIINEIEDEFRMLKSKKSNLLTQ